MKRADRRRKMSAHVFTSHVNESHEIRNWSKKTCGDQGLILEAPRKVCRIVSTKRADRRQEMSPHVMHESSSGERSADDFIRSRNSRVCREVRHGSLHRSEG